MSELPSQLERSGRRHPALQAVVHAADEAPTVQEALRAALAQLCHHQGWLAARLQFGDGAGDLALRTFWHLAEPARLASFRGLARERRNATAATELMAGRAVFVPLPPEAGPGSTGARAICAVPVLLGEQMYAVMELFGAQPTPPPPQVLESLGLVAAELAAILQRKPRDGELRRSEREYRALFEGGHDAVLIVDVESGAVLDANQRCARVYGYAPAELVGMQISGVWPGIEPEFLDCIAAGESGAFEARQRRKDGAFIVVEVAAGPVVFRGRRAAWMSNRDVSERRRTLEQLRASEERYRLLFDASPQAMWVSDQETLAFLAVNQATVDRYGYSREELSRMTLADIRTWDSPDPLDASRGPGTVTRHLKKSGEIIDVEVTAHEIDFAGRAARLVVATDVTERVRAEQKLWHAAFYDALTGLPNRALFMERLLQAQERARGRDGSSFAVLFLDLDRFKVVNDSMGHRAGDQLLVAISRRLERIRRAGDTVARLGGDEFACLVEGVDDAPSADRVADRIQRELAQPFEIDGQEVFTSASIGIAIGSAAAGHKPEDLLRDADTAMYRAKSNGVAKHAIFDITMHDRAVAILQLENDLRRAIERKELRVRYQPIVIAGSTRITGFEALVRWHHHKRGLIPPGDFIPMAEETGVIGTLGRWVMAEACRQMRALQALHPRTPELALSVNLSGRQILQPDLVEQISDALTASNLEPRHLRLEITESVLVANEAAAAKCLTRLRQLGLKLVIDDFGTGYGSLSYLHRMPIDGIKIDASFVHTMAHDVKNRRIVETILSLGRNLGLEVIAEGVETREQEEALDRLGCTLMQGFLFSEAVEPAEALSMLSGENALRPAWAAARSTTRPAGAP